MQARQKTKKLHTNHQTNNHNPKPNRTAITHPKISNRQTNTQTDPTRTLTTHKQNKSITHYYRRPQNSRPTENKSDPRDNISPNKPQQYQSTQRQPNNLHSITTKKNKRINNMNNNANNSSLDHRQLTQVLLVQISRNNSTGLNQQIKRVKTITITTRLLTKTSPLPRTRTLLAHIPTSTRHIRSTITTSIHTTRHLTTQLIVPNSAR